MIQRGVMVGLPFNRLNVKQAMVDLRRALYGKAFCDICCTELGTDMHEIIPRRATVKQSEAREHSFQAPICSLLCSNCHDHRATTYAGILYLLKFNIELYGFEAVKNALETIPEILWPRKVMRAWSELCDEEREDSESTGGA